MLGIVLAAMSALVLSVTSVTADIPAPVEATRSSVLHMESRCTAFVIGPQLVATASHCVGGEFNAEFTLDDGSVVKGRLALLSDLAGGFDDLAIYRVPTMQNVEVDALRCGEPAVVGERISMTGYPAQLGLYTTFGYVAASPRTMDIWPWKRPVTPINITSFGGFSGSAVRDAEGRVVGVLVGSAPEVHDLAVMVPVQRLCDMLGEAPLV